MYMGLSPSNKVAFVSLAFHIEDKGKSGSPDHRHVGHGGEGHTWEMAAGLSFTSAYSNI